MSRSGVLVAFLGPDGVGKSAVLEAVSDRLAAAGLPVHRFHLRPRFGRREVGGPPVTDPHARPPRGRLGSVAKLGYWWLDFTVGYWIGVRPLLARGAVVLFDRYYHDLLVDSRRYRYGGPAWLASWIARSIARPDLFIVLDAPADVLLSRKREVPRAEAERQRLGYRSFAGRLPRARWIDAARPISSVVDEVELAIRRSREGDSS